MAVDYKLSGYHMRACCSEVPGVMKIARDALGNVTSMEGISSEMLAWMSRASNLTYECINAYKPSFENASSSATGSVNYATRDVCDVIVAPVILLRYGRYQLFDFIHPWLMGPVIMLIPMPIFVSDSSAFLKPFSLPVWMTLMCSILIMMAVLMLLDYFKGASECSRSPNNINWLFVIGSLFGHGGFKAPNQTKIRILIVSWLFGSFVLVGLYSSQLFGYVLTNIPEPIVKSAEELADKLNVDVLVVDQQAVDIAISKSDDSLMKNLAKKLEKNSKEFRCPSVPDCMEQVKKSKRPSVFLHGIGPISNVMMNDFRQTGQCNYAIAKKSFIDSFSGSWMVEKGDRNTEFYNKATMRMHEAGLLNHWQDIYQPKPYKCLEMSKQKDNDPRITAKITLKNLAIPFSMLSVGLILAFVVLIFEKLFATRGFNKI